MHVLLGLLIIVCAFRIAAKDDGLAGALLAMAVLGIGEAVLMYL